MVVTFEATGFLAAGAGGKKRDTNPLSDLPHLLPQEAWTMFGVPDSLLHNTGSLPTRALGLAVLPQQALPASALLCSLCVLKYSTEVRSASDRPCSSRIKTWPLN